MKKAIKKFWGIALVVVMLSTLFVVATPTSAADPLQWNMEVFAPMGIYGAVYTQFAGSDIVDFAISADGMTIYLAVNDTAGNPFAVPPILPSPKKLYKGIMGGSVWTDLTSVNNDRLATTTLASCDFVAISPDNPDVVVVMDATGAVAAAASKDGGLNFSDMGTITGANGAITAAFDLDVSPISSGNIYYVAIAGMNGVGAAVYYYNFGAAVGAWHDAVADFGTAAVVPPGTNPNAAVVGAWTVAGVAPDIFRAVQFSSNFGSDFSVLAISEETGVAMYLHIFSLASHKWDLNLNLLNYPVAVETGVITAVNAASITTGPDFMGIEEETIVVFVGASVTVAAAETGGIYRIDETATVTVIRTAGINSITFDGTTVVAGSYDTNNIWRVLDPTANQPTAASARSLKRIGVDDTIAPNDMVVVHFAGANVFGVKRGLGGALSKSTDYGNTWNDFTFMDTTNTVIDDIYMLPDGSAWYMAAHDAGVSSVYRIVGMSAQRVLCTDIAATPGFFMLRGIPGDANVIYAAAKIGSGSTDIYVSADGGVTRWSRKTTFPGTTINDMAVESATVVYVASGTMVYKSTNSGSLWGEGVDASITGGIFNLISLGDGKLVAGGNAGGVEFSTDSGATWTPTLGVIFGGPMYVAATGLGPTDTIFAADAGNLNVYNGPPAFFAELKSMNVPAVVGGTGTEVNTGIVYNQGVLYVLESDPLGVANASYIIHTMLPFLYPHSGVLWGTRSPVGAYDMITVPGSALKYVNTANSVKLYGIDVSPFFAAVYYFEDIVSMPAAAPVLRGPADEALFEIVSPMLADAELVNFTWDRAHPKITGYLLWIALDETFTEVIGAPIAVASPGPIVSFVAARGVFQPGKTYYWKVNVVTPFNGVASETRTFTIAPSAASVPVIASPANGATITSTKPSFSWSPVTGTTKYEFQMDTGTLFTAPMLSQELATTAIMPTLTLEAGKTYFWRVRAVEPVPSEWSSIANFTVAVPEPPPPTPTVINPPTPTFTITVPPAPTITIPPAEKTEISAAYIWAIIIIGAVLVIAVIVLIVRTRRQV